MGLEALESFIDMKIPVAWVDQEFLESDVSDGKRFSLDAPKNDKHPRNHRQKNRNDITHGSMRGSSPGRGPLNGKGRNEREVPGKKPPRKIQPGSSDDDRLAFYSRKYGENFKTVNQ